MDRKQLKKIMDILYSDNEAEAVKQVKALKTEAELFVLLENYNWDNGFELPLAIIQHPCCTLSIALLAFYNADGIRYLFDGEASFADRLSKSWEKFVREVYDGILNNQYPIGEIAFHPELNKIQKFKLKKLHPNLPSVIIEGVEGKELQATL